MQSLKMLDHNMFSLIDSCRYEPNLDIQIQLLHQINENLPETLRIKFPSLLTNDYVYRALDDIENKVRFHEGRHFIPVSDPSQSQH
jgi:hypothetical protein